MTPRGVSLEKARRVLSEKRALGYVGRVADLIELWEAEIRATLKLALDVGICEVCTHGLIHHTTDGCKVEQGAERTKNRWVELGPCGCDVLDNPAIRREVGRQKLEAEVLRAAKRWYSFQSPNEALGSHLNALAKAIADLEKLDADN